MVAASASGPVERRLDRVAIGALAGGHLAVDFAQGAVPAMLPFFVQERHFSYAAAAGLVLAQSVSSSVVQPLFGRLADRWPLPWLMPAGVALSGLGLGCAVLLPGYTGVWLAIAVGGVGVAALHPEAARYANYASGDSRSTGLAVFQVGGIAGFALGPALATPLLLTLGLRGGWTLALPGLAIAAGLAVGLPRIHRHRRAVRDARRRSRQEPDRVGAFLRLTATMLVRAIAFYGLNTFIPLFWAAELHQSKGVGGAALTVLLVFGGIGTLLGGRLAERHSRPALLPRPSPQPTTACQAVCGHRPPQPSSEPRCGGRGTRDGAPTDTPPPPRNAPRCATDSPGSDGGHPRQPGTLEAPTGPRRR